MIRFAVSCVTSSLRKTIRCFSKEEASALMWCEDSERGQCHLATPDRRSCPVICGPSVHHENLDVVSACPDYRFTPQVSAPPAATDSREGVLVLRGRTVFVLWGNPFLRPALRGPGHPSTRNSLPRGGQRW